MLHFFRCNWNIARTTLSKSNKSIKYDCVPNKTIVNEAQLSVQLIQFKLAHTKTHQSIQMIKFSTQKYKAACKNLFKHPMKSKNSFEIEI